MSYKEVELEELIITGVSVKTTNDNMKCVEDMGQLWGSFFSENIMDKMKNIKGYDSYGLYFNYEGDFTKPYSYMAGMEVTDKNQETQIVTVPKGRYVRSMGPNGDYYFNNYFCDTDNVDFEVKDGEILDEMGIKVIHTPGHTVGSCCFYSETDSIIFTGDTMFKGGMGRTDFDGGDYNRLLESLNNLLTLPKETKVYPGHGSETSIGDES